MPSFAIPDTRFAFVDVDKSERATAVVHKHREGDPLPDISARSGTAIVAISERALERLREAGLTDGLQFEPLTIERIVVGEDAQPYDGPTFYSVSVGAIDAIDHDATSGRCRGEPPVYRRISTLAVHEDRLPDDRAFFKLQGFEPLVFTDAFQQLVDADALTGLKDWTPITELDPFGAYAWGQ